MSRVHLPRSTYMHQANRLANEVEGKASDSHKAIQEYLALVRMEGASNPPRTPRVARLRQELTNLQQELAYLMQLREDILGGMDVVAHYDADRQQLLAQLRGVVSGKQAVPKEEIYPLFDQLGGVTLSLIEQSKLLEVRAKLFHALLGLIGGYSRSLRPIDVDKAQDFLRRDCRKGLPHANGSPSSLAEVARSHCSAGVTPGPMRASSLRQQGQPGPTRQALGPCRL